jgi:hypothetical protein
MLHELYGVSCQIEAESTTHVCICIYVCLYIYMCVCVRVRVYTLPTYIQTGREGERVTCVSTPYTPPVLVPCRHVQRTYIHTYIQSMCMHDTLHTATTHTLHTANKARSPPIFSFVCLITISVSSAHMNMKQHQYQ